VFHSKTTKDAQTSNGAHEQKIETTTEKFTWGFQTVPTLYSVIQKVEIFTYFQFLMFFVFVSFISINAACVSPFG
jgi:hypothetical protein